MKRAWCLALLMLASHPLLATTLHEAETKNLAYSISGEQTTVITFINHSRATRKLYWLNYEGQRVLYKELRAGQRQRFDTYLTHPWLVTDADDNALTIYYPDSEARVVELR